MPRDRGFYWEKGVEKWRMGSQSLGAGAAEEKRETEKLMGGGQGSPFRKRERSERAPEVLLVPAPEDESCQVRKGRSVQTPEHQQSAFLVLTP